MNTTQTSPTKRSILLILLINLLQFSFLAVWNHGVDSVPLTLISWTLFIVLNIIALGKILKAKNADCRRF